MQPTLAQRRESADAAVLAELVSVEGRQHVFRVHRVLKGAVLLGAAATLRCDLDETLSAGSLAVLLGEAQPETEAGLFRWSAVEVDEASVAYIARAPTLRLPAAERLAYFVPFLDHPNPLIAEDAYREFGHAPYEAVVAVAGKLPMPRLRALLLDPATPPERKGFLGLALGLAPDEGERELNVQVLERLIDEPANDFRAGFDGVLGGYLVARGEAALTRIEARYLANPQAADGDVRHATSALRFYHEYGRGIPAERLCRALRRLLSRPEFAPAAIVDLARWQDWGALDEIAALYAPDAPPATRRAVLGYLLACPLERAQQQVELLRQQDPRSVAEAEESPLLLWGDR